MSKKLKMTAVFYGYCGMLNDEEFDVSVKSNKIENLSKKLVKKVSKKVNNEVHGYKKLIDRIEFMSELIDYKTAVQSMDANSIVIEIILEIRE